MWDSAVREIGRIVPSKSPLHLTDGDCNLRLGQYAFRPHGPLDDFIGTASCCAARAVSHLVDGSSGAGSARRRWCLNRCKESTDAATGDGPG